jgi:hypothetical protein
MEVNMSENVIERHFDSRLGLTGVSAHAAILAATEPMKIYEAAP